MGAEGLEPSRPCGQRIFILPQLSLLPKALPLVLRIGPSLYPRLHVRVAPVGPLHLPKVLSRLLAWLRIALPANEAEV